MYSVQGSKWHCKIPNILATPFLDLPGVVWVIYTDESFCLRVVFRPWTACGHKEDWEIWGTFLCCSGLCDAFLLNVVLFGPGRELFVCPFLRVSLGTGEILLKGG